MGEVNSTRKACNIVREEARSTTLSQWREGMVLFQENKRNEVESVISEERRRASVDSMFLIPVKRNRHINFSSYFST